MKLLTNTNRNILVYFKFIQQQQKQCFSDQKKLLIIFILFIQGIVDQGQIVAESQSIDFKCKIPFGYYFKLLKITQPSKIGMVFQDSAGNIHIFDCDEEYQVTIAESISTQTTSIFVSPSLPYIALQKQYQLIILKITEIYTVELIQRFESQITINQIKQNENQLTILYTNCSVFYFNFGSINMVSKYVYTFTKCTSTKQFYNPNIFISNNSIYERNVQYNNKLNLLNITSVISSENYLLVFQLISESQMIIFYYYVALRLRFLYQIPTYSFTLRFPLQYKLRQNYLLIVGLGSNQTEVLLLYNLRKQARNCLISVIEFDKGNYSFGFWDFSTLYFIKNETLKLFGFRYLSFSINISTVFDTFQLQSVFYLNLTSPIPSNPERLKIQLQLRNYKFQLRFKSNIAKQYLEYQESNGYILFLNKILGDIEGINFLSSKATLLNPIYKIEKLSYICQDYQHSCCIMVEQIICNIFGNLVTINNQFNISKIHYIENFNNNSFTLFYENNIKEMFMLRYSEESQLLRYLLTISENVIELYYKDHILFVNKMEIIQIFRFDEVSSNSQEIHFQNKLFNFIRYQNSICLNYKEWIFYKFSKSKLVLLLYDFDSNQTRYIYSQMKFEEIEESSLLSYEIHTEILTLKFLLIITDQILRNQGFQYGCIYQVMVNLDKSVVIEDQIFNYIRFGNQRKVEKILYGDGEYIFVKAIFFAQEQQILLFDIHNYEKNQIIDSIYTIQANNIQEISKYNTTHFIQIQYEQQLEKTVELFTVNKYQILCYKDCQDTYEIELFNKISTLKIIVLRAKQYEARLNPLIVCILICNFGLIILIICQKSKGYQRVNKQNI